MSMLDARRHRLLAAMGITPWQLRDSTAPPALDRLHIALSGGAEAGVLEVVGDGLEAPAVRQLLNAMLTAIKLDPSSALIPGERAQAPAFILAFGDKAANALTGKPISVTQLRGQWQQRSTDAIDMMVTHHPATLLDQPGLKAEAWADLQMLQKALQARA